MTEMTLTSNGNKRVVSERERRAAVRLLGDLETSYQRGRGQLAQVWWFGRIHTISAHSIGLNLDRRFEPGTLLTIALHSDSTSFSRSLEACVVQSTRHPKEGWNMACVFAGQLTEAELRAMKD